MNTQEGADLVVKHFNAWWAARTPVAQDDVTFTKPDDFGEFVQLTVQNYSGRAVSVGAPANNRHDNRGLLTATCYCKAGTAGQLARQRAAEIKTLYLDKVVDGITYSNASDRTIGPDGSGYYQVKVTIDFKFEQYG